MKAPAHARELVLSDRRQSLLKAIRADDLYRMRARIDGDNPRAVDGRVKGPMASDIVRAHILENWDRYAEELERWCDFTITGGSTL
jgi:hypothetical protein